MNTYFADTSFFVAYLNPGDVNHDLAFDYLTTTHDQIVTTRWVLLEVGNYLSKSRNRRLFMPLIRSLRAEPRVRVFSASDDLFDRGVHLYDRRLDKDWSLTDCMSFIVMQDESMNEALTADHHFEQAGFTILLK